jgi:hypothetical protein
MYKRVYLAGDNHSCWQKELQVQARAAELAISFRCPHEQSESVSVDTEATRQMAGARCVAAVNDALLREAELIVVRFDSDSDHRRALAAAGQAIVQGKSMVVLHEDVLADRLASISRVAIAVAGDMKQLLSILDAWSNNKATDKI